MTHPNTSLPYLQSVYLRRRVWLDELHELTDAELSLLGAEADGLKEDCSTQVARAIENGQDYGMAEKLLRVAGRFSYAVEREVTARQRKESFLDLYKQLSAVTSERDALRRQLDHLLAK